jgi:DNA-binding beta-propeller fold protein YncE
MKTRQVQIHCTMTMLALIGLVSGCVTVEKRDLDKVGRASQQLVFPAPPDQPRFVFERAIRNSSDVVPESDEGALRRAITGQSSDNSEPLVKPYAVAVRKGKVMVSDTAGRAVRVFDIPAQKHYRLEDGSSENGRLAKPLGLDIDLNGSIYVADSSRKQVVVFNEAGIFVRAIGGPAVFDRLSSVTVDPAGKRLYVVDIGGVGSERHHVKVFDVRTGDHLFDIGKRGEGPGEFNLPRDVAIGKEGRLYVVDGGNFRIQVFDAQGGFIKSFGQVGKQLGNFARPKEIAIDSAGNVYVVDAAFGNFQIFSPDGEMLMYVGERSEKDRPAGYMLPSGIAIDEDDRVYFVDQWYGRIDIFRPYGLKETEGHLGRRTGRGSKK